MLRVTQHFTQVIISDPVPDVRVTNQWLSVLGTDPQTNIRLSASHLNLLSVDPPTDFRLTSQYLQVLVSDAPFLQSDLSLTEVAMAEVVGPGASDILVMSDTADFDIVEPLFVGVDSDTLSVLETNTVTRARNVFGSASDALSLSDTSFSFVVVPTFHAVTETLGLSADSDAIQALVFFVGVDESFALGESAVDVPEAVDELLIVDDSGTAIANPSAQALDTLTLTEELSSAFVYALDVTEPLVTTREVFDPVSLTFSTVFEGLSDLSRDAEGVLVPDAGLLDSLTVSEAAQGWIIPVGPTDMGSDALSLTEVAQVGQTGPARDTLDLSEVSTAIISQNALENLNCAELATSALDGGTTLVESLNLGEVFTVCVEPALTDLCSLREYNPQEGSQTIGTYPDATDTGFKLTGVLSNTVVELPDPNLGNRYRFSPQRINTETRGGTLIIFADPIWPRVRAQQFSFSGMKREKALEMLDFLDTHLGKLIHLVDHEGRLWQGFISVTEDPIVEDRRDFWTGSFEFEGELI